MVPDPSPQWAGVKEEACVGSIEEVDAEAETSLEDLAASAVPAGDSAAHRSLRVSNASLFQEDRRLRNAALNKAEAGVQHSLSCSFSVVALDQNGVPIAIDGPAFGALKATVEETIGGGLRQRPVKGSAGLPGALKELVDRPPS